MKIRHVMNNVPENKTSILCVVYHYDVLHRTIASMYRISISSMQIATMSVMPATTALKSAIQTNWTPTPTEGEMLAVLTQIAMVCHHLYLSKYS